MLGDKWVSCESGKPVVSLEFAHLYRNFITKIALASARVMQLAITTGQACSSRPYTSHMATPTVNTLYIPREMPLTSLV